MRRRSRCCKKILAADPHNLDAALRLATSLLDRWSRTRRHSRRSGRRPRSRRGRRMRGSTWRCTTRAARDWPQAVPILEQIVAETAGARRRGRRARRRPRKTRTAAEAVQLRQKVLGLRPASRTRSWSRSGNSRWQPEQTEAAIDAFDASRAAAGRGLPPRPGTRRPLPRRPPPAGGARRPSTASPRVIPAIRWRCSSARRSASC